MKIFGLAGWSGSGKTTLVIKLIPALMARGVSVSTLKHAHHGFDVDTPGKDSYEHRHAGAKEVLVTSGKRWVLMHELRDTGEPQLDELVARLSPVDLLLIEGFKRHRHDRLEVFRCDLGKPMLCRKDPEIVAVATNGPIEPIDRPLLDLDDADGIAEFIIGHCGLSAGARGAA